MNIEGTTKKYSVGPNTYYFKGIPSGHPLKLFGACPVVMASCDNVVNTDYCTGDASWTISPDCAGHQLSLRCAAHGAMGGTDRLSFSSACLQPPPPPPSQPPPAPPPLLPPPPEIKYARWSASAVGELFKTSDMSDQHFIQRCLSLCSAAGTDACVGFSDTVCGASATRCCKFSSVQPATGSFFLTSDTTYVRSQLSSSSFSSAAATEVSVGVVINPWDDSYEGSTGNGTDGGGAFVGVRVETTDASLVDWRVLLLTLGSFALGVTLGQLHLRRHTSPPQPPPAPSTSACSSSE